jgi:hypothetical protein
MISNLTHELKVILKKIDNLRINLETKNKL